MMLGRVNAGVATQMHTGAVRGRHVTAVAHDHHRRTTETFDMIVGRCGKMMFNTMCTETNVELSLNFFLEIGAQIRLRER